MTLNINEVKFCKHHEINDLYSQIDLDDQLNQLLPIMFELESQSK